jgi:hypothetical protein
MFAGRGVFQEFGALNALTRWSSRPRTKTPNKAPEPTTMAHLNVRQFPGCLVSRLKSISLTARVLFRDLSPKVAP